ncbi:MAG: hypothetical protein PHY54_17935, partial [Methylococcales bacterium]|nr:hypothetical protein [Methylococcales bacterium]
MLQPEFMPESIDIKSLDRDEATALLIENASDGEFMANAIGHPRTATKNRQNPLDVDNHYQPVDLLQHLPEDSFIKQFSRQTAEQCQLP